MVYNDCNNHYYSEVNVKNSGKKLWTAIALSAVSLITAGALVACGGDKPNEGEGEGNNPPPAETTISYQFVGEYGDDTLTGMGFGYRFLLNFYSDSTITYSGYNYLTMDTSAYTENTGFAEKWGKGTWKSGKDEEGEDCLVLTMQYDTDAVNMNAGGAQLTLPGIRKNYYIYENYTFTIDVPFASGRTAKIVGGTTVKYKNYNEFIDGEKYVEDLEEGTLLEDATNHFKMICDAEGNAYLYRGVAVPKKTNEYKYLLAEKTTWSYNNSKLTVGGKDATVTDKAVSLAYKYASQLGDKDLTLTCADASALLEEGGGINYIALFTGKAGDKDISLKVKADGTAEFKGAFNSTQFTWARYADKLVFKEVGQTKDPIECTIGNDGSCTFVFDNKYGETQLGGTVTASDCSAIPQTAVVTFTSDNQTAGTKLEMYADGTGRFLIFNGMMHADITWTSTADSLTLTLVDSKNGTLGSVTVEGTSATFTWNYAPAFAGNQEVGGTFTCADISALLQAE